MGTKYLVIQTGIPEENLTNRIQVMKLKVSGIKDTIEEMAYLVKENVKSKRSVLPSPKKKSRKRLNKRPNLRITGI